MHFCSLPYSDFFKKGQNSIISAFLSFFFIKSTVFTHTKLRKVLIYAVNCKNSERTFAYSAYAAKNAKCR